MSSLMIQKTTPIQEKAGFMTTIMDTMVGWDMEAPSCSGIRKRRLALLLFLPH